MDNETRQYGAQGSEPPRPERPKQYFPDQSQNQQQYAQPAYEQPYQEPYYEPEPKGSSAGAIALGVVTVIALGIFPQPLLDLFADLTVFTGR